MNARRRIVLALVSVFACMGAQYRTPNFIVNAPTPHIALRVGQWAEYYRKTKAVEWLGHEMAQWPQRCPLTVRVTMGGPSGATSFGFGTDHYGRGVVMSQSMQIQGPLDRLIASVLPHEITHTIFAYRFKQAVPRWADEGGSVLSEDDIERTRHNKIVRDILNSRQGIQMRRLFGLKEYPRNVIALYAQGYSIADYLVKMGGDKGKFRFLDFVGHGMSRGWDQAVWTYYKKQSVEHLERDWLNYLAQTRDKPHMQVAKERQPKQQREQLASQQQSENSRRVVRLTIPPQPNDRSRGPTVRGADPTEREVGQTFGGYERQQRPRYLPGSSDQDWRRARGTPSRFAQPRSDSSSGRFGGRDRGQVRLLAPEYEPMPRGPGVPALGVPVSSPVGRP